MPLKQVKADEVVESRQQHQAQHECQAKPESYLLRTLAQRPPQDRLKSIVQKVAAVEHWNRQKISESNGHRNIRCEIEKRDKPRGRPIARGLCNSQRTAQLVRTGVSDREIGEITERNADDRAGLHRCAHEGFRERQRFAARPGQEVQWFCFRCILRFGGARRRYFQRLSLAIDADAKFTARAR